MKNLFIIFFCLICYNVVAQVRYPTGVPTQFSTGWFRQGYSMADSGTIIANRDTTWKPKFSGTVVFRPNNRQFYYFDSTLLAWFPFGINVDTTSLSNRINQKLNIVDTTNKWWGIGKRFVDTVYRVNDSTIGFTVNGGAQQTFQILGRLPSGGGGGTGTVTSVALSMPSAFSVTGSPITTNGTFNVTGAGTSLQYIRGDGTLATADTSMIPNFYLKARGLFSGTSPITYNSNTGAIGITNANVTGTKGAASFTSAFADNGSGLIDLASLVSAGSCTGCSITFDAKGRATAYSSTGAINSLNGLTASSQTFVTGTVGTDFNISSSGSVHTFNIPDAAVSARGFVNITSQTFAGSKSFLRDVVINGITVGLGAASISSNTTIGSSALQANTTGFNNTAIGNSALQNNINGSSNTAIGIASLQTNTSGSSNVAIGVSSLQANVSGTNNVAIGVSSLQANTSGPNNVAIGSQSLRNNIVGNGNTAIGASSLQANTSGANNVAIGASSLQANTSGANNVAIGGALVSSMTGSSNVAIGFDAIHTCTNCSGNIAIGQFTISQTTGGGNVAIGDLAGQLVIGSRNVFIGNNAAKNDTLLSDKLVISNSQTKKLIYGDFANDSILINGKLKVRDIDSTTSALNVLYQDPITREVKKSGAITTLYTGDGTLSGARLIGTGGNTLTIGGANNSDTIMAINNTGTSGTGLYAFGSSLAINAQSTNTAITAFGSTRGALLTGDASEGAIIKSNTIRGLNVQSVPASNNTIQEVLRLDRSNSGGPGATGIGGSLDLVAEDASSAADAVNQIIWKLTDATNATKTSQLYITGYNAGSSATIFTLDGNGTVTTTGKRVMAVTTSSAGTLTLSNSEGYIFNGTTTTWTLPAVSGTTGTIYYIKNIGSGAITLNTTAAANEIYTTSAVNTTTITAGSAIILISNGTYWTVN